MEPAWGHVIFDIDQLERAVKEINSEYFKVTIDLYNLMNLNKKDFTNYKETFTKALKTFKDDVKIIHLKDFYAYCLHFLWWEASLQGAAVRQTAKKNLIHLKILRMQNLVFLLEVNMTD